ncbi:hypothetical protein [Herbiconiux liangxiaofengii]|uniref:hypothetical protein n=1 Tax=Herbiconiux liangxiaofengii TaxID=3342795 RepID=UPI0035B952D1
MTGAFGQVAFAADGDDVAPTSGPAFDTLAQSLLVDDQIQAVAKGADGDVVIYSTVPADQIASDARSLVESKSNVTVRVLDAPLQAYDTDDVVGGAGYFAGAPGASSGGFCSIGFTGWSPEGDPAVISAGHCTLDGTATQSILTLPSGDPAGGGASDSSEAEPTQNLGVLAFAQFGGADNSPGTKGDTKSVDISTIDVTNDDLSLLPEVTDWSTAASEDLSASTITVDSVGSAQLGQPVLKSGRTTGFTTGTVDSVEGWATITNDAGEKRQVYGFGNLLKAAPGDSGGAIMQGGAAVGVLSGGGVVDGQDFVWAADLKAGLALTGGYAVALHLDAPTLTSPADGGKVATSAAITGTAPAGSTVFAAQGSGAPFKTTTAADGTWAFPAPAEEGDYTYTVYAERGFDKSASSTFSVEVVPASPLFTSPTDGESVVTSVSGISGKGEPGAVITLTGDVEGTTTVGADGTWKFDVKLGYGQFAVNATQTADGFTSLASTVKFAVVPVAPAITDPVNGSGYDQGQGPTSVSGTGIDGATVTLAVNGSPAGTTTVANGTWKIALVGQLAAGSVSITATQTINSAVSATATSTIAITAVNAGSTPAGNGSNGSLANTGAPVAPLAGGGIALLLAAGGLLLVARRTRAARAE